MADWPKIKAEYIEGGDSITTLARKHGVNPNTARYHFRKEHWSELRRSARIRTDEIIIETAATRRAELAATMDESALSLMETLLNILERHKNEGYTCLKYTLKDETIVFDLEELVNALAKLARLYGLDAASRMERQTMGKALEPESDNFIEALQDLSSMIRR